MLEVEISVSAYSTAETQPGRESDKANVAEGLLISDEKLAVEIAVWYTQDNNALDIHRYRTPQRSKTVSIQV